MLNSYFKPAILLAIALSMLCVPAAAQEGILKLVKEEIKSQGIDTAMVYTFGHVGQARLPDSCANRDSHYLFWQKDGRTWMKRFDACKVYEPQELPADNPFTFFRQNVDSLIEEEIERPTFEIKTVKRGETLAEEREIQMFPSYSYHQVYMKARFDEVKKKVPTYFLDTKESKQGKPNLFYESNLKTRLYTLIMKIDKFLRKYP